MSHLVHESTGFVINLSKALIVSAEYLRAISDYTLTTPTF